MVTRLGTFLASAGKPRGFFGFFFLRRDVESVRNGMRAGPPGKAGKGYTLEVVICAGRRWERAASALGWMISLRALAPGRGGLAGKGAVGQGHAGIPRI